MGAVVINEADVAIGVKGTDMLLYAAKEAGVKRFVYTSSLNVYSASYPDADQFLTDTDETLSAEHYGTIKWLAEDRNCANGPADIPAASYAPAGFNAGLVRSIDQVRVNIDSAGDQVVDVRAKGRFEGTEPEPRPGMRSGHIPGSINLPFGQLMDGDRHMVMRPAEELAAIIDGAGIDRTRPIAASCGSGVTACVLAFALCLIGKDDTAVYDGSWTEWGGRSDTPIET